MLIENYNDGTKYKINIDLHKKTLRIIKFIIL